MVEHCIHTAGVAGSKLALPTNGFCCNDLSDPLDWVTIGSKISLLMRAFFILSDRAELVLNLMLVAHFLNSSCRLVERIKPNYDGFKFLLVDDGV